MVGIGLFVVARVAIAVLNCSTAMVIIVQSAVSSCFIDTSSPMAYSLLELLSALDFTVLWLLLLLLSNVVAVVALVEVSES